MKRALFLDRDGTINFDYHYVHSADQFVFIPGIVELIKKFNEAGWLVIVVTNQAGVARGYYDEKTVQDLHRWVDRQLEKQNARIDAWYYCPHHPEYGVGKYKKECHCRKPDTGMIEEAMRDFDIDIPHSIMYGDKPWDVECGERMGMKGILFEGEKHEFDCLDAYMV